MIRAVLAVLLLVTLGVGSRVLFPVEKVGVAGKVHLTADVIDRATGLVVGEPWLWAWDGRLDALRRNPWVKSARLERPALGELRIVLEERRPIATVQRDGQRYGLAADGTLLPGAPERKPILSGRGEMPLEDLIALVQTFPGALGIAYDASGYRVTTANLTVWGASVRELQSWAKSSRIGQSAQTAAKNQAFYVYSWGVSTRR